MSASRYAKVAENYWRTYLPSQVATMENPTEFFQSLGTQVQDAIDYEQTEHQQAATSRLPENATYEQRVAALTGAAKAAEEQALTELVFLPPEPGTEERRLEGLQLAGWDQEPETATTPA